MLTNCVDTVQMLMYSGASPSACCLNQSCKLLADLLHMSLPPHRHWWPGEALQLCRHLRALHKCQFPQARHEFECFACSSLALHTACDSLTSIISHHDRHVADNKQAKQTPTLLPDGEGSLPGGTEGLAIDVAIAVAIAVDLAPGLL